MIIIDKKHYKVNLENPIKSKKDDIFGYDYEVKRIKNAIDDDANVIGIISDYGSGKSSLIQLLIRNLNYFRYKVIKVNLWDNRLVPSENKKLEDLLVNETKENSGTPLDKSTIRLHRTFLRQVASQINKYKPDYINRRINANYGAAKISFPSYKSLITWFFIYILLLAGLLHLICKFGFDIHSFNSIGLTEKKAFISFIVPKIPNLIIGFAFFYIIFNKEVLFSFWNNSKTREITEEDTIQIYNEMFGKRIKLIPRFKKIVIIIEDLDRIEKPELVEFYLNEFYRLYIEGNEGNRKGITMIFCLNDGKNNDSESKYVKIFDYISYINRINIDDNEEVLKQLVARDKLLHDLTYDKKNNVYNIKKLSWLIEGKKNTIRTIKRRIENFKSIYLMIYSRGRSNGNDDLNIDFVTCSFAAYLKTEYNYELDTVLSDYDENGSNFIDRYVNKKIISGKIDNTSIDFNETDNDNSKELKKLIIDMINDGYIDSQYKQYFYNFPMNTKIYTTSEKYVSDFIINNSNINNENLSEILEIFKKVDEKFIYNKIDNINSRGKDMPTVTLYEANSFKCAQKINEEKLKNKFKNELSLIDKNVAEPCKKLNLLRQSNIDKEELSIFISDIINENVIKEEIEETNMYIFREFLIDCFKKNIINFNNLYKKYPLSKTEIERVKSFDTLISMAKLIEHDDDSDKLICEQFNKIKDNNKSEKLIELINILPNYKSIYSINIDNIKNEDKYKIYLNIIKNRISNDEKLELLLYLDYIKSDICDSLISESTTNIENLIKYMNKQTICTNKCIDYIARSNKLYDISDTIYNSLDEKSEKYHAYYIFKNHKIDRQCDEKMLSGIFIKYWQLTPYFKNDRVVNILKQKKVYRNFKSYNTTKEKVLVLTNVTQTKDMVKSIISNDEIPQDIKCLYLENINKINKDASKYIRTLIIKSTPVEILKSIDNNRKRIYQLFDKNYKTRVKKDLNKLI